MLDVTSFQTGTLSPTRTYAKRSFVWIPAVREHHELDGLLGQITIKLQPSGTGWGRAIEIDTYSVSRDTPEPGDNGGEAFWFFNLTDADAKEPYRVVIGGLTPPRCRCMAGKCRVPEPCKHVAALVELVRLGVFDDADEAGGGLWFHDGLGEPTVTELELV